MCDARCVCFCAGVVYYLETGLSVSPVEPCELLRCGSKVREVEKTTGAILLGSQRPPCNQNWSPHPAKVYDFAAGKPCTLPFTSGK